LRNSVIALVSNNIATDQRLIKVGNTLQKNGFDFHLIGTKHRGKPNLDYIPFSTHRANVFFKKNFLFYAELQLRLFIELFKTKRKNSIILANDLDTLIPAVIYAKIFNIPLITDFHDIFSERPSLKDSSIPKKVWKFLERIFVPGLRHTYTVSDAYAKWFRQEYGIEPKVIKNVPVFRDFSHQTTVEEHNIIIYQGAINQSRGIDQMILAMNYIANAELWIVGDGPLLEEYKNLAKMNNLEEKVIFHGRVSPEELRELTLKANLGLSLEQDNGLSYRYALPNKIFDYIHAGIPILGSCDLPEMKNIITTFKIGDIIKNHDPVQIAEKIIELLGVGKANFQENLKAAANILNWENQEQALISIFKKAANE